MTRERACEILNVNPNWSDERLTNYGRTMYGRFEKQPLRFGVAAMVLWRIGKSPHVSIYDRKDSDT
jgi:hypothetical protein